MIPILIDGQQLPLWQPLRMQGNVLMAPVRGVIDRLADQVYQPADGSIVVSRRSHHLILYRNQERAFYDGHWISVPRGAERIDQAMYVPLRATAEAMGLQVAYRGGAAPFASVHIPSSNVVEAMTPIPIYYPVVYPHVVITPTPVPRAGPTAPPHPELRRTPLPVGPFYRLF